MRSFISSGGFTDKLCRLASLAVHNAVCMCPHDASSPFPDVLHPVWMPTVNTLTDLRAVVLSTHISKTASTQLTLKYAIPFLLEWYHCTPHPLLLSQVIYFTHNTFHPLTLPMKCSLPCSHPMSEAGSSASCIPYSHHSPQSSHLIKHG